MGTIVSLINRKGGSTKSTASSHLGWALPMAATAIQRNAASTCRSLVVDFDAQMHAGKHLGVPRHAYPGIGEVLFEDCPIREAIRATNVPDVYLLPGSRAMRDFDLSVADLRGRERILADLLTPLRDEYDYIVIDCPPGAGLIHANAFLAADWLVVPSEPEASAMEGILELQADLAEARAGTGARAELLGILFGRVDLRTREHRDNLAEARNRFGSLVLDTTIRTTTRMREACREHLLIQQYDPCSQAGRDYEAAAAEIRSRIHGRTP